MGCSYSAQSLHIPLTTLEKPVAALDVRNCAPHPTTLADRDHYPSAHKRKFYDAASPGSVRFETTNEKNLLIFLSSRQQLLDSDRNAIASYKHTHLHRDVAVHAVSSEPTEEPLFTVSTWHCSGNKLVHTTFHDVVSNQQCDLVLEGDWDRKDAVMWLDRGQTGERVAVAKIYVPSNDKRAFYHVDVATNMDAAIVVLMCLALLHRDPPTYHGIRD